MIAYYTIKRIDTREKNASISSKTSNPKLIISTLILYIFQVTLVLS